MRLFQNLFLGSLLKRYSIHYTTSSSNQKPTETPTDHVGQEGGVGDPGKAGHPLCHPAVLQAHGEGEHESPLTSGSTKDSANR